MGLLDQQQLATLAAVFHLGSSEASRALTRWLGRSAEIVVDSVDQVPLEEVTTLLAAAEEPVCYCVADMSGPVTGQLILAFDDASGMALADMLLDQTIGDTTEWTEVAQSSALETTNIVCCSYLNALAERVTSDETPLTCLPSPPSFGRDYAEALLQSAVMTQAMVADLVVLVRTRFSVSSTPFQWVLLFVPDAESMDRLPTLLVRNPDE